jgi:hypothetical protein
MSEGAVRTLNGCNLNAIWENTRAVMTIMALPRLRLLLA